MAFHKLLLLFILCQSKGCADYQRTMFVFALLLQFWEENNLPIAALLSANHTVFSEESGEIALSVLARGTPASSRADIEQINHSWQMVWMRYFHTDLKNQSLPQEKKHHLIRTFFRYTFFCLLYLLVTLLTPLCFRWRWWRSSAIGWTLSLSYSTSTRWYLDALLQSHKATT